MKKIIFLIVILFVSTTYLLKGQDIVFKGGIGFYTLYDNNILVGIERSISLNPTPIIVLGLSWKISDGFALSWENALRLKKFKAQYFGLDTSNNQKDIYGYKDFELYNIDTKIIGKLKLIKYKDIKVSFTFGGGLSLKITSNSEFTLINPKIFLICNQSGITPEIPGLFNNSGVLTELGIETNYKNFIFNASLTMELFKAYIYDVGDNKSFLTQITIGYLF